jgi:hypothetical protein
VNTQTALANLQRQLNELEALCVLKQKDQQRLAAENERLRTELNLLDAARTEKLIDELRTENERLRKANEWLRGLVATESCPTCAALSEEDE